MPRSFLVSIENRFLIEFQFRPGRAEVMEAHLLPCSMWSLSSRLSSYSDHLLCFIPQSSLQLKCSRHCLPVLYILSWSLFLRYSCLDSSSQSGFSSVTSADRIRSYQRLQGWAFTGTGFRLRNLNMQSWQVRPGSTPATLSQRAYSGSSRVSQVLNWARMLNMMSIQALLQLVLNFWSSLSLLKWV